MYSIISAIRISRTSWFLLHPITCSTLPCEWFSHSPWWGVTPTTTIGTPLPWDSRPLGNPVFRYWWTYKERLRFPIHILKMSSLLIVCWSGCTINESRINGYQQHRCTNVIPKDVRFHHWILRFKQFSFNHIIQALQSHNIHVFCYSPLYRHALVPSPFRV